MFCRKNDLARSPNASSILEMSPKQDEGAQSRLRVKKQKEEKLVRPAQLYSAIEKQLIEQYKIDINMVKFIMVVLSESTEKEGIFNFRIFDTAEANALNLQVKNYATLTTHPDLILYEGWIDGDSQHIEMNEKRKLECNTPLLMKAEIMQKIEALNKPGSTVFFYQARGPSYGGPLGRGSAIVELNPEYKNRKVSKYIIYTSNMVGENPVGPWRRLWRSNSVEKTAELIHVAHHKRVY